MSDFTGLISAEFKQLFVDAIDEILSDTGLTVPCSLIYSGSKQTPCDNCIFNVMTGRSSGQYKQGGPISFSAGVCPKCSGVGRTISTLSETLYLAVIWDSKQWLGKFPVGNPNEFCQTISKATTFDEIKRASHIIIDTTKTSYSKNKYERVDEPGFVEFGSTNYIFTTWKRVS